MCFFPLFSSPIKKLAAQQGPLPIEKVGSLLIPAIKQLKKGKEAGWNVIRRVLSGAHLKDLNEQQQESLKAALLSAQFFESDSRGEELLLALLLGEANDELIESAIALCSKERLSAVTTPDGRTALDLAFMRNSPKIAEQLIALGMDVKKYNKPHLLEILSDRDPSSILDNLMYEFEVDSFEDPNILKLLNGVWDKEGNSILHYAVMAGAPAEIIQKLLDLGMNPNRQNLNGETPLFVVQPEKLEQIVLLLNKGADPLIKDQIGNNFWNFLLAQESYETITDLIVQCENLSDEALSDLGKKISFAMNQTTAGFLKKEKNSRDDLKYMNDILNGMALLQQCGQESITDTSKNSYAWNCFVAHRDNSHNLRLNLNIQQKVQLEKIEKAIVPRCVLGHINKQKNTDDFLYEGLYPYDQMGMKKQIAHAIGNVSSKLSLQKEEENGIREIAAIENSVLSPIETLESIRLGKLTFVRVGHLNHAAYLVFWGSYLIICNRGDRPFNGDKLVAPLMAYKIDPSKMGLQILQGLMETVAKGPEIFFRTVYENLPNQLSPADAPLKDDICLEIEKNPPKDQTIGNCAAASFKAAIQGAFRLNGIFNGPKEIQIQHRLQRTHQQFKLAWSYVRAEMLNAFIRNPYRHLASDLEEMAFKKIKKHLLRHIPRMTENLEFRPSQSSDVAIAPTANDFASVQNQVFSHPGYKVKLQEFLKDLPSIGSTIVHIQ